MQLIMYETYSEYAKIPAAFRLLGELLFIFSSKRQKTELGLKLWADGRTIRRHWAVLSYKKSCLRLDLLWTAPELLYKRHAGLNTKKAIQGTQPGDVYGFAIILQEILYRRQTITHPRTNRARRGATLQEILFRALPYQATGEQTMVTKGQPRALTYLLDDSGNEDDDDDDDDDDIQRCCGLKNAGGRKLQFSDRHLQISNRGDIGDRNFNFALKFPLPK